jgi:hypothetical protein
MKEHSASPYSGVVLEGIFVLYAAIVRTEQFKNFKKSASDILVSTIAVYIRGFCTQQGVQKLDEHIVNSNHLN